MGLQGVKSSKVHIMGINLYEAAALCNETGVLQGIAMSVTWLSCLISNLKATGRDLPIEEAMAYDVTHRGDEI